MKPDNKRPKRGDHIRLSPEDEAILDTVWEELGQDPRFWEGIRQKLLRAKQGTDAANDEGQATQGDR